MIRTSQNPDVGVKVIGFAECSTVVNECAVIGQSFLASGDLLINIQMEPLERFIMYMPHGEMQYGH